MAKKALFWKELNNKDKTVQCQLCPHYCTINNNELGKCKARQNKDGSLISLSYGKACTIGLDPIEKKPLYHFLPKKEALSIATAGCNLSCGHCQNFEISQCSPRDIGQEISPKEVIEKAKQNNAEIIAYTYTEPTIFYEYMLDIAKLAKKEGIKNVMISNGFINQEPLKKLIPYLDAANIDFKAMSDKHYQEVCGARLKPVLETIKTMYQEGVWIELTNLLITGLNDSEQDIEKLSDGVNKNLGNDVPIHFSAFYPVYKMKNREATTIDKLREAREIAKNKGIKYVYTGNLPDPEGNNTYCPECGNIVIKRSNFSVIGNKLEGDKCPKCGEKISGFWY